MYKKSRFQAALVFRTLAAQKPKAYSVQKVIGLTYMTSLTEN